MGKAARWLGLAALAAALLPLAFVQEGCQGTCASNADCGGGSYCEMASGECLLTQPIGFCKPMPTTCPPVNQPLCGCDGKQYTSSCEAAQAGVSPANDGTCTTICGGAGNVACKDASTYCHFMDGMCGAAAAVGTCDPLPTACAGAAPSPVCGCDGKTYDTPCEAAKAQVSLFAMGTCPCGGPSDAACGSDAYCNLVMGACLGPYPTGTCEPKPTSCPGVVSPVCGCDGKTYDNACEAAKAGMAAALTGACPTMGMGPGGGSTTDAGSDAGDDAGNAGDDAGDGG